MSLTQCDRSARCNEDAHHKGPCSFLAPFKKLIDEIDRWKNDLRLQELHNLEDWIKEELKEARQALE